MRPAAKARAAVTIALALGGVSACTAGTSPQPTADPVPSVTTSRAATPDPVVSATVAPVGPTATPAPQQSTSVAPSPRSTPEHSGAAAVVTVTTSGWDATAHQLWVSGFVPTPEEGGTCTLTVSKGTQSVVARSAATADATTTTCGSVTIDGTRLSPGAWSAVLAYQSPTRAGAAGPVTIEVP